MNTMKMNDIAKKYVGKGKDRREFSVLSRQTTEYSEVVLLGKDFNTTRVAVTGDSKTPPGKWQKLAYRLAEDAGSRGVTIAEIFEVLVSSGLSENKSLGVLSHLVNSYRLAFVE